MAHSPNQSSNSTCNIDTTLSTINWIYKKKKAWEAASAATIKNCWQHTGILHPWLPKITLKHPCPLMPANLEAGWDIVFQFAMEQWSISEVHTCLQEPLGDQYISNEWNKSLDSVLRAEDDTDAALAALDALCNQWAPNGSFELCEVATTTNEQKEVEGELLELVAQLKEQRCIIGWPCTLEALLDPEEWQIGETPMNLEVEVQRLLRWFSRRLGWL